MSFILLMRDALLACAVGICVPLLVYSAYDVLFPYPVTPPKQSISADEKEDQSLVDRTQRINQIRYGGDMLTGLGCMLIALWVSPVILSAAATWAGVLMLLLGSMHGLHVPASIRLATMALSLIILIGVMLKVTSLAGRSRDEATCCPTVRQ